MQTAVKVGIGVGAVAVVGGVGYWLYRRRSSAPGALAHTSPEQRATLPPGTPRTALPPPPPPQSPSLQSHLFTLSPGVVPAGPGPTAPAPGGGGNPSILQQGQDLYNQGKGIYEQGKGIYGSISSSVPGGLPNLPSGGSLPDLGSLPGLLGGGGSGTPDFGSFADAPPRPVYSDSGISSEWTGAVSAPARAKTWRQLRLEAVGVRA